MDALFIGYVDGRGRVALSVTVLAFALLAVPFAAQAQTERWQFGSTPTFSSGRYGTDTRTEVVYTPITARRLFDAGDVTFVVPFTCIRGNGAVTVVSGAPVRTERTRAAASTVPAPTRGGTDTTGRTGTTERTTSTPPVAPEPAPTAEAAPTNTCGLGDVVLRARYYVVDEHKGWPTVALRAHVKAPTASAEEGLGTGRPDEGVGVEVSRTVARGTMVLADAGYTVVGQPADFDYANNWWYDVGLSQNLARGVVNLSVFFEESRAIVAGFENAKDVLLAVSVKGRAGWRIQVAGQIGLSDGSPDHGITVGASRRF